jgi:hypothetical protein
MDIRYDLISDTSPKMSTNSWSRMCCKSLSKAMKVPVRPTPALQKKIQNAYYLDSAYYFTVENKLKSSENYGWHHCKTED